MAFPFDQIITPENIVNITIQYTLPQSGFQPAVPSFVVNYGSPNKQKSILLQECFNYINYLKIKAIAEGKSVVATQFDNNKTVISVGDAEPLPVDYVATFKLDAVNFTNPRNLAAQLYTSITNNHSGILQFLGGVFTFSLPSPSNGTLSFAQEYSSTLPFGCSIYSEYSAGNWLCQGFFWGDPGGDFDIEFTSIPHIEVDLTAMPFDLQFLNDWDSVYTNIRGGTVGYLPKDPFNPSLYQVSTTNDGRGASTVQQYSGVSILDTVYAKPFTELQLVSSSVDKVVFTWVNIYVKPNGISGVNFVSPYEYKDAVLVNTAYGDNENFINIGPIIDFPVYVFADADAGPRLITLYVKRLGAVIQTINIGNIGSNFPYTILAANRNFDELLFEESPIGSGYPITLKPAVGSPCAAASNTYYISHTGTIVPGDTVYTDLALTTPLAGFTQIVDPTTGIIYAIDNVTGIVGAATGGVCSVSPNYTINAAYGVNVASVVGAGVPALPAVPSGTSASGTHTGIANTLTLNFTGTKFVPSTKYTVYVDGVAVDSAPLGAVPGSIVTGVINAAVNQQVIISIEI